MSKIKAIIFDFDGVIVESMGIKADAFLHVFREYPQIKEKIIEFHMQRGGMPRWEKFKIISERYLGKRLSDEQVRIMGEEFGQYVFERVIQAPFVKGALEFLMRNEGQYLFFIVSGTPQEEIDEIIRRRQLDSYFKEVFGAPATKAEAIMKIVNKYGLTTVGTLFIGDALDDYEGAMSAGVNFIGRILDGHNNFVGLSGVKGLVQDLSELQKYV